VTKRFFIVPLIVALLVPLATANPLPNKPHIYVEGSAEIKVPPDQMMITVGISDTNQELAVAKKNVDERSRRLIAASKQLGIAPEDLATTALHISPAYDFRGGEQVPLGTRVYRQVDITLRDLAKYPQLMAALVDAEISETINTRLEVADDKALTERAMAAAIDDARQRAKAMAQAVGRSLGGAYSVSEFDLRRDERQQVFRAGAMRGRAASPQIEQEVFSDASEPFEPGLIIAGAKAYVVFLLK
jgi:uncharacterized protein YggE